MPKHDKHHTIEGRIVAHNISPKGSIEGLLLKTKKGRAQINLPKHGEVDTRSFAIGEDIRVDVSDEHDDGDHPVYAMAHTAGSEAHGKVERLNYARHGEVNGVVLTDGTFVHLKPEGARKHGLRVGDIIRVSGRRIVGSAAVVLEADEVVKERARASA